VDGAAGGVGGKRVAISGSAGQSRIASVAAGTHRHAL
jgi:hypothetical protein